MSTEQTSKILFTYIKKHYSKVILAKIHKQEKTKKHQMSGVLKEVPPHLTYPKRQTNLYKLHTKLCTFG